MVDISFCHIPLFKKQIMEEDLLRQQQKIAKNNYNNRRSLRMIEKTFFDGL